MKHFTHFKSSILRGLLSLFFLTAMVSSAWGTEVTWIASEQGYSNGTQYTSAAVDSNISLSFGDGANDGKYYTTGSGIRIYSNGHMTVSASNSNNITKIVITYSGTSNTGTMSAEAGDYTLSEQTGTWSGSAASVKLVNTASSGHARIQKVVVTYSDNADSRTAVNLSAFTTTDGITTIVKGNTLATSITNDQSGWTASYTYTSNNSDVATVSSDGVITAVAKGTATITASLNIASDDATYKTGVTRSKSIVITVTNPTHKAVFSANGTTVSEENVEEGETITLPASPADIEGKTFVGWTDNVISGVSDTKPNFVSNYTMGTSDLTFYAVFAKKNGEATTEILDFESETNSKWVINGNITRTQANSSYSANSGSYYGLFNSNVNIQFKDRVNATEFSYCAVRRTTNTNTSIKIQTSTNGTTWTDAETSETKWGDFKSDGKTYKKVSLSLDGNPCFVRLNIATAANRMIDDISITYGNVTYSGYCTTVSALKSIEISQKPKTTYNEDETLDLSGLELTASYENGISQNGITTGYTSIPANGTILTDEEFVTITWGGKTCSLPISVNPAPRYAVSINTPENGFLSVMNGEIEVNSGDEFKKGTVLNITATPADGYKFRNLQVVDASTHTFTASNSKAWTMGDHDITIKANFDAKQTVTIKFIANGEEVSSETGIEGSEFSVPANPVAIGPYVFAGWVESITANETTTAPTLVSFTDNKYTGNADKNFYALYSHQVGNGAQYVITRDDIPTAYNSSGATINISGVSFIMTSVACFSQYQNNIQFMKSSSSISASNLAYNIQSIEVTYANTNTNRDLELNVNGNISPSQVGNVYKFDCSSKKSKSFTLSNYSSNTNNVDCIVIDCGEFETYYTTSLTEELTSSANLEGWKTFYNADVNYEVDENTNIYKASLNGDVVTLHKVNGNIVPKQTAVLLKTTADDYKMKLTMTESESSDDFSDNILSCTKGRETGYILSYRNEVLAFYCFSSLPANKVYIPSSAEGAALRFVIEDDYSTGISTIFEANDVEATFNIAGQKATENKGLLIKNGKVIMIK